MADDLQAQRMSDQVGPRLDAIMAAMAKQNAIISDVLNRLDALEKQFRRMEEVNRAMERTPQAVLDRLGNLEELYQQIAIRLRDLSTPQSIPEYLPRG